MEQIYNKINNHKVLDYDDMITFINNKSNGRVKAIFSYDEEGIMSYNNSESAIIIDANIKNIQLEYLIKFTRINDDSNYINNSNFLIDLYNMILITMLYHELEHSKQYKKRQPHSSKNNLVKENIKLMEMDFNLYLSNHDLYYHEYDAMIKSIINTLNDIKNYCTDINVNSILEYNRNMSAYIYHAHGNKYYNDNVSKIYSMFKSPISYTKHFLKCFYNPRKLKLLSMDIKKLKRESTTEYMKLVNGFKISEQTSDLLYDILMRNYYTQNIFEEIKKIDKEKTKYF